MKSKCSFILKVTTALVLAALMMVGSITAVVGAVISNVISDGGSSADSIARNEAELADASAKDDTRSEARDAKSFFSVLRNSFELADTGRNVELAETGYSSLAGRIYFDNSKTSWSNCYLYVGHGSYGKSYTMTNTGYHNIWYVDISDGFTDRTKLYFANHNDSPNGQNYGIDTQYGWNRNNSTRTAQITANNNDAGSLFTPSSSSAGTLTRTYPRVVAGTIASNGWDDCTDIMSASSTPSKTYENVAAGDYSLAVVGFYNNWSPSYRWSAKGTLTANNIASWADAGDGDHNIKLTTTAKSNVTITLNSSNKVDITVSPVASTYTGITAVAKGTTDGSSYSVSLGTIQSSTSVNSSTGLAVSAGSYSNYTFSKWVSSGSGTFANANNASTTFYPAANSEVATAQYKRSYSVTKNSPSNGTITLSKTTVLAGDTFKVTLAPSSGYRVATFTVGGVDKKSSLNSSNEYTHTASGTGTSFAVSATFEAIPATTIYIKKTITAFSYLYAWDSSNNNALAEAWPGSQYTGTGWSSTTDDKYYYKSFTWNCANFKFDLNNNAGSQTGDSIAYATGKSYYIDTAAARENGDNTTNRPVLTEGTPSAKAITYTSTYATNDVTWGGTKPASAYPNESVSFTVTAKSGYKIKSVKYNDGSDHTLTASSGTYTFIMPSSAVTVTATTVKTYSVSLTTGTGIASKQYKLGSSGTYATYSSALTVEEGTDVYFKVTYTTGYEYASNTGLTVVTANTEFKTGAVSAAKAATINAQKITWSGLSAVGKYSTTGASGSYTNTWSSGGPNVTIAATSATQLDGVAVSAPGTDPTGYVFAGWITNNGSFTNAANKDTTFKPNAANAQAVATYKKIYTISASVASNGTGAGAAPTISITSGAVAGQTNKLVAGGSYSVTASPVTGSGVESITVNNTNKGSNTSYTISSVSADQTVVVKYKSKVYLKGTMNSTAWAGDVMTANAAGTSYTIANVVLNASTTYQFRHWVDSGGDGTWSSTVATNGWVLNGLATHSTSGDNLTITPSVKIKVTFISDGSKFTSITAIPYDATQYNVTFKKVAGSTITGEYMGTSFSTAEADAVVPVYSGTEISFTATADSGKYLSALTTSAGSLSPAFSVGDSYTGKIANVTSARTVTPTVANKFTITAKSNKTARGTVSVSPTSARPSQTITITVSPKAGILKTLTYTYAGGKTYNRNFTANRWDEVTEAASTGASAPTRSKGISMTGANAPLAETKADATYTFTMDSNPTGSVTVNATFDPYTADSSWYYNGYDTSGNKVTAYWGKQMTEGMVSGEKFSYYHVVGRTGTDQLFTVSNGRVADTRYVYFTRPKSYSYWNQSNSPKAHFWKNGGSDYDTWPGNTMTWVYDNDMGEAVFKIAIPVGADRVSFNDASNSGTQQTVDIDLTNTSGAYYVSGWNNSAQKYNYGTWNTGYDDQGYVASGTEYFYDSERYTADFSTKGFYNHNVNSKDFTKPKDLGSSTGDYYVNILYAGKTYTINGVTKTVGSKDLVIWSTEPLAGDDDTVKVYAKDGAIRSESFGSTYANIADTQIVASASSSTSIGTSQNGNISGQTYETYNASKGETIYIRTTINTTAGNGDDTTTNRNKYYVRGFCINGEVFELKTWDSSGVYTTSFKIPEDYEGKYYEVTPIYYLKDTNAHPIVTYRVTGFTDELKEIGSGKPGWGDTLYTYPYYGKLGSNNNALGAYPGQPMVYYKGQYQMQIPEQSTAWDVYLSDSALSGTDAQKKTDIANTNVSGVTMSNGYYDSVHRLIMGYGSNGSSSDHVQTYDYGDFFKIFNEKAPVDNIVFDFKYETKKHNFENQPASTITKSTLDTNYGTNGNGFEILTNFHGRHVDLFGTPLSGDAADPEKTTPVYVISIGGVNGSAGVENIAGYYATEWMVYGSSNGTNYTRITGGNKQSIPPEVLILNNKTDSFNNTVYPSAVSGKNLTDWQALYTNLEAYRGKPVMISYEAADAQIGAGNYATSGGGGATRNDGRWLYSKNGETITSKIRVDVSEDNGATYTPNDDLSTPVSDLDAAFTNAEADGETTYTTTIDPDKTFDFEAHSNNADYKFMGWYMADGTKITTDNIGHTERSGSYTFVARFMHFTGGQLILGHKVATDSTYKGAGTTTIAVTVKDGNDELVREFAASSSDVTLDDKIINNENTAYTIEVTLNAAGTGEDTYARTTCTAANTFFGNQSAYTTMPQTFSFTVGDLFTNNTLTTKKITYNSYFNKTEYSYKYTFNFTARDGSTKSYVREGTLTAAQREQYVTGTGNESRMLTEAFVNKIAPHESNFMQTLKWEISAADRTFTKSGDNYTLTKTLTAVDITAQYDAGTYTPAQGETVKSAKLTATFSLPYAHTNGVPENALIMDETETTNFAIPNLRCGQLVKGTDYVTAPRQLRVNENGSTVTKNFQYWSIAKTSAPNVEIARCYYYSFNFVAYSSYYIQPVYGASASPLNSGNATPLPTISFLETSRNQFNGTGATSAYTTNTAADILYNDFVLSYEYQGIEIYKNNSSSNSISKIGYVVDRVQKLETKQDGTPYTDPSHYSDKSISNKTVEEIKTFVSGNTSSSGTLTKYELAKDSLDNKNRIEFYEAYYNSKGWTNETQQPGRTTGYKNFVYKAYSFMIVDGTVYLSDPVYFTMYEEAAK